MDAYHVTFLRGSWRISYAGQYFGDYDTADLAAVVAIHIAEGDMARGLISDVVVHCIGQPVTWDRGRIH